MNKQLKRVRRLFFQTIPMHLICLLTSLLPNTVATIKFRGFLLRPFFKSCGKNLKVASGVVFNNPHKIELGNNVYIAHNVWINGVGGLRIDNNVLIGPMSVIVTSQHMFEGEKLNSESKLDPVYIQSDCWLASHVVITDGVEIGHNTLVAAGAVVTKSVPKYSQVGGIPAKSIGVKKNVQV